MARAVDKYLARYAEPEARLALPGDRRYARCLVVPACAEDATLLDGFRHAASTSSADTLAIVVANARDGAGTDIVDRTEQMLGDLVARIDARPVDGAPALFGRLDTTDVLLVDRCTSGRRFDEKQGVGLARKIGNDVALASFASGRAGPLTFQTDADATLPEAHFDSETPDDDVGAIVFPFWHAPSGEPAVDRATALYEVWLRYYVLGLHHARSPYAFHTVGSAIALSANAYAAVRGFPNREAGEDFYMLDKVAKVAVVARVDTPPILIAGRRSDRTPFGTGAGIAALLDGEPPKAHDPRVFDALRSFVGALDAFAAIRSTDAVEGALRDAPSGGRTIVGAALRAPDVHASLDGLRAQATSADDLRRRVHEWFGAFRTLELVHSLRDGAFVDLPLLDAVERASFCPSGADDGHCLEPLRRAMLATEPRGRIGPLAEPTE